MEKKLAHHGEFKDYTEEELNEIKNEVCIKNNCPYLRNFSTACLTSKNNPPTKACDYISIAGHMRGCMPDECTHYLDKNVKKRVSPMTGNYQI